MKEYNNNFMLLTATDHGHIDIVKFLIEEAKVDINEQTESGECAIHRACYRDRVDILNYLILKGADKEIWKTPKKLKHRIAYTPLYMALLRNKAQSV